MCNINIRNETGDIIETIVIKTTPMQFIIYRGRLLEKMTGTGWDYIERVYLEVN